MGIEIVALITVGSYTVFLLLTLADLYDWQSKRPIRRDDCRSGNNPAKR